MQRIALVILAALCFVLCSASPGQSRREIHKTLPLPSNGRLVLDTYKGSVTLDTWEKNEVEIRAIIEPDEDLFGNEADKVANTEIRISGGEREVRVRTDYDAITEKGWSWLKFGESNSGNLPVVHYTITIPRTAAFRMKDYKSTSVVRNVNADVSIDSYKGEITVTGLAGSLDLDSYKGNAKVSFAKLEEGSSFNTYKGSIAITLPRSAGFSIDTKFGRRVDFDCDFEIATRNRNRRDEDQNFRGSVNGGGPTLRLKSDKGSFKLLHQ